MATAPLVAAKDAIPKTINAFNTLADALGKISNPEKINMHIRRAITKGDLDVVLQCARRPKRTNISMRTPEVMRQTMYALRQYPQQENWSKSAVQSALRRTRAVATLLDSETSGYGIQDVKKSDPRQDPALLGTYLELAAIDAAKHNAKGKENVHVAANRLITALSQQPWRINTNWDPPERGEVDVVLNNLPVWSGLVLAERLLGKVVSGNQVATDVIASYGSGLKSAVDTLKARGPKAGSYAAGAIKAYESSPAHAQAEKASLPAAE